MKKQQDISFFERNLTFWVLIGMAIGVPCGMIGASNFFELAVAVSILLFGLSSGATLATVVGVLVEVPVMLFLVKIANSMEDKFNR